MSGPSLFSMKPGQRGWPHSNGLYTSQTPPAPPQSCSLS